MTQYNTPPSGLLLVQPESFVILHMYCCSNNKMKDRCLQGRFDHKHLLIVCSAWEPSALLILSSTRNRQARGREGSMT